MTYTLDLLGVGLRQRGRCLIDGGDCHKDAVPKPTPEIYKYIKPEVSHILSNVLYYVNLRVPALPGEDGR